VTASQRIPDGNGWYEIKANPISRAGIFPYSGRQLGLTGPDADRVYQVLRPAEELAAPECVESFKLIPWIDNHTMLGPTLEAITPDAIPAEAKGVQGVIGEDVFFKDGTLFANIKVFSSTLAKLIQSGKKELSAGYRCVYDIVSGVFEGQHYDAVQREIRGNHLALVQSGRMGPRVAVLDHMTFSFDAKEFSTMADDTKTPPPAPSNDGPKAGDMTLADLVKIVGELAPQVAKVTAALASMSPGAAAPAAPVEDADKPVTAAAMDAALTTALAPIVQEIASLKATTGPAVLKDIAARDALVQRITPLVGAFDHAEMTAHAVAVYGCEKLGIKVDPAGAPAALAGYLHAAPGATPPARVALDSAPTKGGFVRAFINGDSK